MDLVILTDMTWSIRGRPTPNGGNGFAPLDLDTTMTIPIATGGHQEVLFGETAKVVEAFAGLMATQQKAVQDAVGRISDPAH
jgi:hypothetical protein